MSTTAWTRWIDEKDGSLNVKVRVTVEFMYRMTPAQRAAMDKAGKLIEAVIANEPMEDPDLVYALIEDGGYDGDALFGIYSTIEKAEAAARTEEHHYNGIKERLMSDAMIKQYRIDAPPQGHLGLPSLESA